jgi:hypothetical protein
VLDLLQQHPDFGLFGNTLSFFLKHTKQLLDLVQEVGERERLLMLVVECVAVSLRLCNALTGVPITAIIIL